MCLNKVISLSLSLSLNQQTMLQFLTVICFALVIFNMAFFKKLPIIVVRLKLDKFSLLLDALLFVEDFLPVKLLVISKL